MYSLMSIRVIACSSSNRNAASARASSVLPTPVGPRNRNEPMGRRGSLSPARARRTASDTAAMASSCPTTRSWSRSSMWTSFASSPSMSRVTGMPVHFETMSAISSAVTSSLSSAFGPWSAAIAASCWVEPLLELALRAVLELRGALVVRLALGLLDLDLEPLQLRLRGADRLDRALLGLPALLHRARLLGDLGELLLERLEARLRGVVLLLAERLALDLELDPAPLELVELDRHRVDLHAQPRRRLVDEVDRLVRQEPLGDVAVRQGRRGDERRIGDPDAVVDLVALAQAAQDRDRLLDRRLVDEDLLEAPLQRGVLLDVLAVLVERRRADRVQLAAGEHRLEQVGGVHRALGRARADDGVELVDEQDHPAVGVLDLLEDGLEALLELATELGAGDQGAEVERDDALVLERLGHVAADDPLREALDDRGLADARARRSGPGCSWCGATGPG